MDEGAVRSRRDLDLEGRLRIVVDPRRSGRRCWARRGEEYATTGGIRAWRLATRRRGRRRKAKRSGRLLGKDIRERRTIRRVDGLRNRILQRRWIGAIILETYAGVLPRRDAFGIRRRDARDGGGASIVARLREPRRRVVRDATTLRTFPVGSGVTCVGTNPRAGTASNASFAATRGTI